MNLQDPVTALWRGAKRAETLANLGLKQLKIY